MDVREAELPGVGRKFAIRTDEGERITIIIHNTGAREIYSFRKGEDFPFHAIRLDDDEAHKVGAILSGAYFQPAVASMDMILDQLSIEWVKVPPDSILVGHSIMELGVRSRTGASIIAILHDGRALPNPAPEVHIEAGDTLVVVGSREQVDRFLAFARGVELE